jgi:hypothetical protein
VASYRSLGLCIARPVFREENVGAEPWRYLGPVTIIQVVTPSARRKKLPTQLEII